MSKEGDVFENPVTGERAVTIVGTDETDGERLVVELTVQPGGAVVGEHVHPEMDETFTVLEGEVGFRLDGDESVAEERDSIDVPAGVVHDWWNAGDGVAKVRVDVRPGARFEEMILTLFGLAQDGKTNAKGMPNLLQMALLAPEFEDVVIFVKPPRPVQKIVFACLGPVARILGYRATYPRYRERMVANRGAPGQERDDSGDQPGSLDGRRP